METNHTFGLYYMPPLTMLYVMDDFGNAVWLADDWFRQFCAFAASGIEIGY